MASTPDPVSDRPAHFELRMGVLFAAIFVPMGIHLPYFPLWLEAQALSAPEIALILSAPMFVRVAAIPIVSTLADRAHDRIHVMIGLGIASLCVVLGYFLTAGAAAILAVSIVLAIVWSPTSTLADSLATSGVRRFGSDYARMRVWGSISFLLANLGGGFILARVAADAVIWLLAAGMVLVVAAAIVAPRLGRPRRPSQLSASELPGAGRVLSNPYFLFIAAGCGLVTASHGLLYAFASIYWKSLGIGAEMVGLLWGWSVIAEVMLFAAFRPVFGSLSAPLVLTIAATIAVLRWLAMPFIWPTGLGLAGFFAIQTLHAFSVGLTMLGLQKMIAEVVPEERMGSAQGSAAFISGAGLAMITLLSGPLYDAFAVDGFLFMAAAAAVAILCALLAWRSAPERGLRR
ncbi:MFS transporter [Nitratireductor mangrovi]|uniref:MFS transporter n=1 Tax=Nitratireductor mangrovi TaxID=2599600 RepID=A0A5B8L2I1_9HYPH|nr:MFS transporter [Nitratireductor mangrovi]QDZ01932.1 MFS transporter [Nitratireductor mangrovi]